MAKDKTSTGGGGGGIEATAEFVVQGGGVFTATEFPCQHGSVVKASDLPAEKIEEWTRKGRIAPITKPLAATVTKVEE